MTKIDQNSSKSKNTKIDKNQKSSKVTKIKKHKNSKSSKSEKWKMSKNDQKMHPPSKWPKCHLNDQNRHFVKSEPPGPAFFRFQGVPRDPVLRPDLDPPYFSCFLIIFYHFSCFWFCAFHCFLTFYILVKVTFCDEVPFFNTHLCNVIRPYGK